jgi:hypothetical protein
MTTTRAARRYTTLALLVLAALGSAATAAPPPKAPTGPAARAKNGPVKLLAPGGAPLAPLRLSLSKTAVEKGVFSYATTGEVQTASGPQKIEPPKMSISMTATHTTSKEAGAVAVGIKLGALKLEGPNAGALEAQLRGAGMTFEGNSYEYVVTTRGLVTASSVTVGPGVAPNLRQIAEQSKSTLDLAMLPLPDAPVGVGARWQQESKTESGGVSVDLVSTYELLERTKTFIRVKRSVVAKAKPGLFAVPGTDTKLDLLSFEGTGEGEVRQTFNQVLPTTWQCDLRVRMTFKADGQTLEQTITSMTSVGAKLSKK